MKETANHPIKPHDAGDILVIVAHPAMEQSRANHRLTQAAHGIGGRVQVRDLYALYPDYLIDVEAEQAALARVKLIVWQHPIHWYHMPPLMKLWMDEVLTYGWAYGPGGRALADKDVWLVASTGGTEESYRPGGYNRYFFDAFLPPYEQTAALCHMRFLPPLLMHGSHLATADEIAVHASRYAEQLTRYPDWPEIEDLDCAVCEVPEGVRPVPKDAQDMEAPV